MVQRPKFTSFFLTLLLAVIFPRFASCNDYTFAFDHDTGVNCDEYTPEECESNKDIFFVCPISCAKALQPPNEASRVSTGRMDDEAFYQLQATDVNGKEIDFENYEGYITVIAALPKQPAVAQFYYEMLEHLHEVYPYTLEILVVPLEKGVEIAPVENPKVALLDEPHDVLTLLQKGHKRNKGKATLYLVNAYGDSVEDFVSTTMPEFQKYLEYHFKKDLKSGEF